MATRGQVKRALEWADWLALKPKERATKKTWPPCVTCGREANGSHISGQPRFDCRHGPFRVDDALLERGRRELGG